MHKKGLLAGASAIAIAFTITGAAYAQDMMELPDLSGESVTIFGPWVGGNEIEAIEAPRPVLLPK